MGIKRLGQVLRACHQNDSLLIIHRPPTASPTVPPLF